MSRPDTHEKVYRAFLRLLPRAFRDRYGDEMAAIAAARFAAGGTPTLITECASLIVTSVRIRLGRHPVQVPALVMSVLLLMMVRGSDSRASGVVDFSATDPAGEFTLKVVNGRAIGGSIDRQPLSSRQLVHAGDSIRVLDQRGRVVFAVAFDRSTSTIEWSARPAACRGRALECGAYQ